MSGGLGNIFGDAEAGDGPRGQDMKVDVEVPRSALGTPSGFAVPIPVEMSIDGGTVKRRLGPGEAGGRVQLHLPTDFRDGSVLRLRGQGGEQDGGRPGDLFVTVRLVNTAATFPWLWVALVALLLGGGAVWFSLAQ